MRCHSLTLPALALGLLPSTLASAGSPNTSTKPPNVVFIMTDDQDLELGSMDYMPLVNKHIRDKGTTYKSHYCTTALCCPSRATVLTGRLAHNHNITDVSEPYGGYGKVLRDGINDNYLPIWLQEAGWDTYYVGKLYNNVSLTNYMNTPKGWTGSDFLIDPYTYQYYNASFSRNGAVPVSHEGEYNTDVVSEKALGYIDEAAGSGNPFFLGVAPIGPHGTLTVTDEGAFFSDPLPAKRHENLFQNLTVPRTPHFNPDETSGVSWIGDLPKLNQSALDANDQTYRVRLQSLQAVDEMVEAVVNKLDEHGILDDTYIIYTTDNGYHIGQHRLEPGKACPIEEDVHIPLHIRGPGIEEGSVAEIVTQHTDLAPTILSMIGVSPRDDFDGEAIPLMQHEIWAAADTRFEHVQVEYWGSISAEGAFSYDDGIPTQNNTYKALRVITDDYNIYYSVWCDGGHEVYDMKTDPYQLTNMYPISNGTSSSSTSQDVQLLNRPLSQTLNRLDALTMVLKTCKRSDCTRPWEVLHPEGGVSSLGDAVDPQYDAFYAEGLPRVRYDHCVQGQIMAAEGPVFDAASMTFVAGGGGGGGGQLLSRAVGL